MRPALRHGLKLSPRGRSGYMSWSEPQRYKGVLDLLPVGKLPPLTNEDGEAVVDDGMRRVRS